MNNISQQQAPRNNSFPLQAVILLLKDSATTDTVYILSASYLRNWLSWALHQQKHQQHADTILACAKHTLQIHSLPETYESPGPIDGRELAEHNQWLLLRRDVHLINRVQREYRVTNQYESQPQNGNDTPHAVAVPESFYELLRSTHGVICNDLETISFQKMISSSTPILYNDATTDVVPIEFKRHVVPEQQTKKPSSSKAVSLMEKLVLQDQQCTRLVELHPVRILYTGIDKDKRCIGMSKTTIIQDAVTAVKDIAVPRKAATCVRVWMPWWYQRNQTPTMEVIPDGMDNVTLADWADESNTITLQLETRKNPHEAWATGGDLHSRIQPGDCVDAQDVAGSWFEASVIKVSEDTVTVHYLGWASRWNATLKRYDHSTSGHSKLACVRPLWSTTSRWREALEEGDEIEVRDTSSLRAKPKWYRGIVRKLEREDSKQEPGGGAELETDENGKPLLLLHRRRQILVEVEQEKLSNPRTPKFVEEDGSQPPHLRWVYLFGEEICKSGTHLKESSGPTTLRYEVDGSRKPVEVMKSMHGAGFLRESLRGMPPAPGSVGLHNLGNSCFLNSIIQCMNHLEPLTNYFLEDKYSKDINSRNPLGSGGNVSIAYASLIKKVWAGNHSVLVPRLLKQTVASFAPQFDNSYQHDSQEFCQFLMDGLHEDLNRVKKKPYVEELEAFGMNDDVAAIESWRKHLLRHDSVIVDHCQGMHRSHLTCPQCGRESIKFDIFSSISLPIPTYKENINIGLQDCIDKFMEAEQLDERDAYYCPSCRRHVCALKLIALWTVPDVLIIHLKRFTFDACIAGGMLRSKVDNTVEFPINGLDLSKEVLGPTDPDAPPIYNLVGVSEHSGPTANSGHYTATVRNSMDKQWYRCNDSHVGRTSGEASITGGAYVLFYQRAKGISKWGGMHRIMKERGIDPFGGGLDVDQEGFTTIRKRNKKK